MNYFEIKIQPSVESSSDVILVDNFHPRWQEGAQKLLEGRIEQLMSTYVQKIHFWSKIPVVLDFSKENGLNHISLPFRKSLDLWPDKQKYRSHNINSVEDVGVTVAVISHYIGWMNYALKYFPITE
jgi:hypothetical protein